MVEECADAVRGLWRTNAPNLAILYGDCLQVPCAATGGQDSSAPPPAHHRTGHEPRTARARRATVRPEASPGRPASATDPAHRSSLARLDDCVAGASESGARAA